MSDKEKLDYFLRLLDDNFTLKTYAGIELTYEELHYLTEKLAKEIEYRERVRELETVIEQDERQAVLEGMYEQNKRYREALEFYADEGTYEVVETLPPTDEYQQPIEPVFKTVPIIYYDKGKEARKALEE